MNNLLMFVNYWVIIMIRMFIYMQVQNINQIQFYISNYYLLPKWADPEKSTFMQAVKIINFKIKINSGNKNVKYFMEESKIADISIK